MPCYGLLLIITDDQTRGGGFKYVYTKRGDGNRDQTTNHGFTQTVPNGAGDSYSSVARENREKTADGFDELRV